MIIKLWPAIPFLTTTINAPNYKQLSLFLTNYMNTSAPFFTIKIHHVNKKNLLFKKIFYIFPPPPQPNPLYQ